MPQWIVGFPSHLAVVGHNPEMADLDNPRGEIISEVFTIVAEDAKGNRRVWGHTYPSPSEAEAAYLLLSPPIPFWTDIHPSYGSEAYVQNWQEIEADKLAAERDAEVSNWFAIH